MISLYGFVDCGLYIGVGDSCVIGYFYNVYLFGLDIYSFFNWYFSIWGGYVYYLWYGGVNYCFDYGLGYVVGRDIGIDCSLGDRVYKYRGLDSMMVVL